MKKRLPERQLSLVRLFLASLFSLAALVLSSEAPAIAEAEIDFKPFMAELAKTLKEKWQPVYIGKRVFIRTNFVVDRAGRVSQVKITSSSGDKRCDASCLKAIEDASPFARLPEGSPEHVNIQFTFDCDQSKADHPQAWQCGLMVDLHPVVATPQYMRDYLDQLQTRIEKLWHVPEGSEATRESLSFTILPGGQMQDLSLDCVTGDNRADAAALKAVEEAAPFPPLPAEARTSFRARLQLSLRRDKNR